MILIPSYFISHPLELYDDTIADVIGDLVLYPAIGKLGDSLLVGISSSLAFSISGIFTSMFGVWYQAMLQIPQRPKFGTIDSNGNIHFNHSINKEIEGPSQYSAGPR